jgi:hypothetical protein
VQVITRKVGDTLRPSRLIPRILKRPYRKALFKSSLKEILSINCTVLLIRGWLKPSSALNPARTWSFQTPSLFSETPVSKQYPIPMYAKRGEILATRQFFRQFSKNGQRLLARYRSEKASSHSRIIFLVLSKLH